MTSSINPQRFDYFLVLDFEATCEENKKLTPQVSLAYIRYYCIVPPFFATGLIKSSGAI